MYQHDLAAHGIKRDIRTTRAWQNKQRLWALGPTLQFGDGCDFERLRYRVGNET
jgi:hypothetical protein